MQIILQIMHLYSLANQNNYSNFFFLVIVLTDPEERANNSSYCPAQDINLMRTNSDQKLSFYMDSPDSREACVL